MLGGIVGRPLTILLDNEFTAEDAKVPEGACVVAKAHKAGECWEAAIEDAPSPEPEREPVL